MHFTLLTHTRELEKNTGTGKLVKVVLQETCDIIEWSRTAQDPALKHSLSSMKTLLIYPTELAKHHDQAAGELDMIWPNNTFQHCLILDGTWQEAKKMYNRSPYLHVLPHYSLHVDYTSQYQLRRNQKNIGLCTAEVVLELLKRQKEHVLFDLLTKAFSEFNTK